MLDQPGALGSSVGCARRSVKRRDNSGLITCTEPGPSAMELRQRPAATDGPPTNADNELDISPSLAASEISSSVPLQMLLYYNVWFSIVYFIMELGVFIWKAIYVGIPYVALVFNIIVFSFWLLVEPFRLLLGYSGNLQEKVPQLTAFGLVTFFPQMALVGYLVGSALASKPLVPFDFAANLFMLLFLLPELVFCFFAIRRLVQTQTSAFFLQWTRQTEGSKPGAAVPSAHDYEM